MRSQRSGVCAALLAGLAVLLGPSAARAASHTVMPGQSIQAAVDAASPGDTIIVQPGDYVETHGGTAAVRVTKSLKLRAKSNLPDVKVRILPGPGNLHGIVVEPENPGDPDVVGVKIRGFTVEGFDKHGIWLRHVDRFKIDRNESINNLENGIFPTLSANGLVKKNLSYGSEDAALWVEASENVRVIGNEVHSSPTGLEITVSKNIIVRKNDIHDNTIGVGLYHPNGASLPPLGDDGNWEITNNRIYNNNAPNTAPPGSLAGQLPPGGGILVIGVDRVHVKSNYIENNNQFGIAVLDWCLAVDCNVDPPIVEPFPDDNTFVANRLVNNGTAPVPAGGLELFSADITYLVLTPGHTNCFAKNVNSTQNGVFIGAVFANSCG